MSDRIQQLQGLLERIKKNAARPRARRVAPPPPAPVSDTRARSFARAPEPEEEVPVPLVRVAPAPMPAPAPVPEPPPVVEAPSPTPFSMTSEVTTVEFVESVPPAPVAEADVEDLSSDLLESLPPPAEAAWAGAVPTSTELLIEEEPPISSQRPRLVSGLEETLSESPGSEAPLKTPPPESGPQEAPPQGLFVPSIPNVDQLLDEGAGPISRSAPNDGPSLEQIGESVELDEREGPAIELAEAVASSASIPPSEELEAMLDAPPSAGIYDEALMPPPGARDELEAHDRRFSPTGTPATPVEVTPSMPAEASIPPALPNEVLVAPYVPPSAAEATGFAAPEVFSPAMPSGGAPEFRAPAPSFRPQSFLELLDASLALRG